VRGCSRSPYPRSSPIGIPNRCDNRATAGAGAAVTSSGTNPSHGNVHNYIATPSTLRPVRYLRRNASSALVNVKYRIRSARVISGNPRSRASSSPENTARVATRPTTRHADHQEPDGTLQASTKRDQRLGVGFSLEATGRPPWGR
jgi:hypothetical protein